MPGEHKPRFESESIDSKIHEHKPIGIRGYCTCGLLAINHRPSHNPKQWPICDCGAAALNHRVKHKYSPGCCNLPKENHISAGPSSKSDYRYPWVGIDGEGIGRDPHKYVLMCAQSHDGRKWSLENLKGLRTKEILDWILENLGECRVFSFAFGYDITCILRDLPNNLLYKLLRPSLRYERARLRPIAWRGYSIDWLQGQLTIARKKTRVVIWDIFKFFQAAFVKALKQWGIDTQNIEEMKEKRGDFKAEDMPKIREYCFTECYQLANLAKKLVETHKTCGLTLHSYYGPGSTASIAISQMKAIEHRKDIPKAMTHAVACGFFGGRFEHALMGIIKPVYGYDISSAYPYQLYNLPCLLHGKWTHVTSNVRKAIANCTTAIIRYSHESKPGSTWAPFPHRDDDGSICYPRKSSGWLWLPEILAGMRFGKTRLHEAWVYTTTCTCHPFADVAKYYRRRVELGKDAAGIVLKLACNSIYGKLAQSIGPNPKFQCWVWAGLVTAGTRAMILNAIASTDPANIIGIATDGIFSKVPLKLAKPSDTGTYDLKKPLGGWEEKEEPEGMLFLKPGIYFALSSETVKARGIGRKALFAAKHRMIRAWKRGDKSITLTVDRFHGAKTSISPTLKRSARYGQWSRMPIRIAFECPNRAPDMSLLERLEPSHPYNRSLLNKEKADALITEAIQYEQP